MQYSTPPSQDELRNYLAILERAATSAKPEVIPNSGKEHAALMMATMFGHASKNVSMIAGNFCGEVSNNENYKNALESALARGVKVSAIVLDEPSSDSQALPILKRFCATGQVRLYLGSQATKDFLRQSFVEDIYKHKEPHFAIFDNETFRLEFDQTNFSAIGVFHRSDIAERLNRIFNDAVTHSQFWAA